MCQRAPGATSASGTRSAIPALGSRIVARHGCCSGVKRGAAMRRSVFAVCFAMGLAACGDTTGSSGGGDAGDGGTGDSGIPDGATGCRSDTDCNQKAPSFELCARVEDPMCGGAAPPQECTNDAQCADAGTDAGAKICVNETCGARRCTPRCTSHAECPSNPPGALACSMASGQCQAKPCTQSAECPTNYTCDASHVCSVKTCTTDADCSGACVNRRCSASVGICRAPAA